MCTSGILEGDMLERILEISKICNFIRYNSYVSLLGYYISFSKNYYGIKRPLQPTRNFLSAIEFYNVLPI